MGFVIAGIKEIDGAPVGDTITTEVRGSETPLPGFKQVQPRVFAGVFPVNTEDYENFRDALAKLRLNDSALHYEPEVSTALGFGFRIGFLGLLHMDIVQERLEREYNLELITSAPTVVYEVAQTDGTVVIVDNPARLPPWTRSRTCASRSSPPTSWCRRNTSARAAAVLREARRAEEDAVPGLAGLAAIPAAAGRSGAGFLRPPEELQPRLCLVRLRVQPFPVGAAGQARHPDQRRQGRCAVDHRAPGQLPTSAVANWWTRCRN